MIVRLVNSRSAGLASRLETREELPFQLKGSLLAEVLHTQERPVCFIKAFH